MTQKSIPWPGVAPGSGADAGRYTAPEWWGAWATEQLASGVIIESPLLRTDSTFTNVGVYYAVGNQLAVTSPGNNQVRINTGAWMADGQFGYNDTSIGTGNNIVSPAANPRIDRVVVRKNYSAATYTPGAGIVVGTDLDVPPTTARVTVIAGTEAAGPVAPALVQDTTRATYWDIPLAQYEISVGGVISSLTDEREWIDAATKQKLVSATGGFDTGAGDPTHNAGGIGYDLPDSVVSSAYGSFIVPVDFIKDITVQTVIIPEVTGTGNIYGDTDWDAGTCGEGISTHSGGTATSAIAVTELLFNCIDQDDITGVVAGDFVRLNYSRNAVNVLDTVNADCGCLGWLIEYFGWKR